MKLSNIEFVTNNKGEIIVTEMDEKSYILNQTHRHIISEIYEFILEEFPGAAVCLQKRYANSALNHMYFQFLIVRMWLKLHAGSFDHLMDIDAAGNINFEYCYCPKRGECDTCDIQAACYPERSTKLRKAEINVLRLLVLGLDEQAVSDSLCIALNTVKKHRQNMLTRYKYHKTSQLIELWHRLKFK